MGWNSVTNDTLHQFISITRQWGNVKRGRSLMANAAAAFSQVLKVPSGFFVYQKQLIDTVPKPIHVYSPWGNFARKQAQLDRLAKLGELSSARFRELAVEKWLKMEKLPSAIFELFCDCDETDVSIWPIFLRKEHFGALVLAKREGDEKIADDHVMTAAVAQVALMLDMMYAWRLAEESEKRYRSLFTYNSDAVYRIDANGNLAESNGVLERITGYSTSELTTREQRASLVLSGEPRHPQFLVNSPESEQVEFSIATKNGQEAVVLLSQVPIISDGEVIGHYGILKDLTERRKIENWMQRTEKLSLLGQLAAGIAHEIRNPLASLRGFVQLLAQRPDNRSYCDIMLPELDRINAIVGELLMLAKPEVRNFKPNDVPSMIDEVMTLLTPEAHLTNTQMHLFVPQEAVPLVRCDRNQIKQVFVNILTNSLEAMPDGGTIEIELSHAEEFVLIRLKDQGWGIPPDKLSRIGEPFYTTKERGTGLGLMVSHQIVESHCGRMTISSQVNRGTIVEVSLPVINNKTVGSGVDPC